MIKEAGPHKNVTIDGEDAQPTGPSHHGDLMPLRTKAEVDAQCELAEAFVVEVPAKRTAVVLRLIDTSILQHDRSLLSHLRRVIRREHLPTSLRLHMTNDKAGRPHLASETIYAERFRRDSTVDASDASKKAVSTPKPLSLHVLLCAAISITHDDVLALLSSSGAFGHCGTGLRILSVPIPLNAPASEEQAQRWSREYWPTVYNKNNPFGPQPVMVHRAGKEIKIQVGTYMNLARTAGRAVADAGVGEDIGAVIVDRTRTQNPSVLVVAGDGRWKGQEDNKQQGVGNAMAHAVMRAIGMVAQKRRVCSENPQGYRLDDVHQAAFAETPLTPMEHEIYSRPTNISGGYLCLDLEIYITHEPCVMCCMALLHSRFGRVVFGTGMARTGGLLTRRGDHVPHAADHYRLRLHRARSVVLTNEELVEIRAAQRTFEGAYIRTALGQFSFSLVILKIFTSEFYSIGALFAIYGAGVLLISLFRRQQGNKQFFSEMGEDGLNRRKFRTSGNVVVVLTALSIAAYACLLGLTLKLRD
ncbi:MAG: hypothetical protein Q9217_000397 [Psora testacea]